MQELPRQDRSRCEAPRACLGGRRAALIMLESLSMDAPKFCDGNRLGFNCRPNAGGVDHHVHCPKGCVGKNVDAAPIELLYSDLEREADGFASVCPACEIGILPVHLHPLALVPLRQDRCLLCGQVVLYKDDLIRGQRFYEAKDDIAAREAKRCEPVGTARLAQGWGCCRCRTYNGEQRSICRACRHERCDLQKEEGRTS